MQNEIRFHPIINHNHISSSQWLLIIEPIGSGTIRKIEFSKYTLSDNGYENTVGNNDGIANKNETLRMNVEIRIQVFLTMEKMQT